MVSFGNEMTAYGATQLFSRRGWPEKAMGKNRYGKMSRQLLTCRTQWLGVAG